LVEEVAQEMEQVTRDVEELDLDFSKDFAFPITGNLAFTQRLVAELDDDALRGIIAHEIGHLKDRAKLRFLALGLFALYPLGLLRWLGHHYGLFAMAGLLALCIGALAAITRFQRGAEERADAAVDDAQLSEGAYARGLEQIHRCNAAPAVMRENSTHPNLYDRMEAAGVTPDFPRPAPPRSRRATLALLAGIVVMTLSASLAPLGSHLVAHFGTETEKTQLLRLAIAGPKSEILFETARQRMASWNYDEALVYIDASIEANPGHHAYRAARTLVLARTGHCDHEGLRSLARATTQSTGAHSDECPWIAEAIEALRECRSQSTELAGY